MLRVLLLLACLLCASAEVLLEVKFDISPTDATSTGYTAEESINAYLNSAEVKWLRYYKPLITSGSNEAMTMRVAHIMFQDMSSWAQFEQANRVKIHALFDYFWVNTQRMLLKPVLSATRFPKRDNSVENPGGYVYQLRYTVANDAVGEFSKQWGRLAPFFSKECDKTAGFVERQQYSAAGFTKTGQNVVNYEFSDMQSLLALMNGRTFLNIVETLKPLCTEWQTVMLSPGDYSGAYFLGKGADPK